MHIYLTSVYSSAVVIKYIQYQQLRFAELFMIALYTTDIIKSKHYINMFKKRVRVEQG